MSHDHTAIKIPPFLVAIITLDVGFVKQRESQVRSSGSLVQATCKWGGCCSVVWIQRGRERICCGSGDSCCAMALELQQVPELQHSSKLQSSWEVSSGPAHHSLGSLSHHSPSPQCSMPQSVHPALHRLFHASLTFAVFLLLLVRHNAAWPYCKRGSCWPCMDFSLRPLVCFIIMILWNICEFFSEASWEKGICHSLNSAYVPTRPGEDFRSFLRRLLTHWENGADYLEWCARFEELRMSSQTIGSCGLPSA